ncbi:MAG: transcriptional regulator, TraR/DksA family, partial [Frankiales bacterium]|nr:transcriptional regulator, TraR/DksA family [Frankiales bacterium]
QLATLIDTLSAELDSVDDAFTRLAEGAFGRCERCGEPIGAERLAARPATRRCVTCAARASGG